MSEAKDSNSNPKSSKDILNELFSSFNASFEEEETLTVDNITENSKKKKKKSKKGKKSRDDDSSNEESEVIISDPGKKSHKKKRKTEEKPVQKSRKKVEKKIKIIPKKKIKVKSSNHQKKGNADDDDEDVDKLIEKHRKNVRKHIKKFKGVVSGTSLGDLVIKNDELFKSSKERKISSGHKKSSSSWGVEEVVKDVEDGEILDDDDARGNVSKKKQKSKKMSASQAYKLDMEEKILLGMEPVDRHRHRSHSTKQFGSGDNKHERSKSVSESQPLQPGDLRERIKGRDVYKEDARETLSMKEHSRSARRSKDEEVTQIRHAPPRDPSPIPVPVPMSSSSRSSYNYNDTGWQKARNQDNYEGNSSRRRERGSGYDTDTYYQKETSRRSDGRMGFGFTNRSYYDGPLEHEDTRNRDRDRERSSYNNQPNQRQVRGRSRSPVNRNRSTRRSRSRSPRDRWNRSRSRSRDRSRRHPDDIIDKAKLLEIARKNAGKLISRGVLPSDIFSRDQIMAIRAGGKSVDELTDYCRRLAKKDARGDAISDDSGASDGEGSQFIHHPYNVKDRPLPQITLNIRNAIPIPVRTHQEMAIESAKLKTSFPVSSGTQHRVKELEWHPINKEEEEAKAKAAEDAKKSLVPLDGQKVGAVVPVVQSKEETQTVEAAAAVAVENAQSKISLETPRPPEFDISDVIAIRLKAMRQLSENPDSNQAKKQLEDATQMMKRWADAKALEPKFLSQSELTQGPQAWAKRDQLVNAKEVQSPMGLHLLQKMGWKPGEGLGKDKCGDLQPLALEVKTDKKGLTSVLDFKKGPPLPVVFDLSGKHPISALMELCSKRKWGSPGFDLVFEHGPPHKKQFVYKVVVNGVEYQPCVAVNNKKLAKANSAAFCLQSLGLLPTVKPATSTETLQTVQPIIPPLMPPPMPPSLPSPISASTKPSTSTPFRRFSQAHYLQTVPTATVAPSNMNPPLPVPPPNALMLPPPPPPPSKKFNHFQNKCS